MRQRSALRRLLMPTMGIAIALGSAPLSYAASAADESPTRIGTVAFDRKADALVIPLAGSSPIVQVRKLAPRQYVADLANSVLAIDQVQGQRLAGAPISGWSLDETPAGHVVRLRLTLADEVQPTIQVTKESGRLVFRFKGQLAHSRLPELQAAAPAPKVPRLSFPVAAPVHHIQAGVTVGRLAGFRGQLPLGTPSAMPSAAQAVKSAQAIKAPAVRTARVERHVDQVAVLGAAHMDKARHLLVVPVVKGELPVPELKIVKLNHRWAYVDVPGTKPSFGGVRYANKVDPMVDRWVMARRPGRDVTRVSFALSGSADMAVKIEAKQLLISIRPKTMILGKASAPRVAAVPAIKPVVKPASKPMPKLAAKPVAKTVAVATQLRRPFFDENRYGLVVPYSGHVPLYRMRHEGDRRVKLELKGSIAYAGRLLQNFRHHPLMESWSLERNQARGTVSIGLRFHQDADLVIAADPERRQLLLIPQPSLAASTLNTRMAASPKTFLAPVERDAGSRHLYIPFSGDVPNYTVEQISDTFAYINFERSTLKQRGVHFFSPQFHPSLNYWLFSEKEEGATVRLALALTQPGGAMVYEDHGSHRLVVVVGDSVPQAKLQSRTAPMTPGRWIEPIRPAAAHPRMPRIGLLPRAS